MKIVLITIIPLILIFGCTNDLKEKKTLQPSPENNFISKRHLQEITLARLGYKTEQEWDSLHKISHKKVLHKKGKVDTNYRTFGWHPYFNGSSYKTYNFSMLWGISYFSYSVHPQTGGYKNIHQWKTTALIDSAKAHNSKVFLTVSNFGKKNNTIFLNNPKAQNTLIDSISNLLAYRNANGITIDFEGIPKNTKDKFTKFIVLISNKLKAINPEYMISLSLYAMDWNDIFDIHHIDPYIDFYTLMGYDYYGSFSKTTGPVTPFITSNKFGKGLQASVQNYSNKGVNFKKLIVGLPYYGAEWYTNSPETGANVVEFKSHPSYKSIRKAYIDSLKIPLQFDPTSASSYIVIKDNDSTFRQLYFEDVKSLSIKYDWIKNTKISGVGFWCLGYDNGYPELWDLLYEKFSKEHNKNSTQH
ncbi:glycosyl hydrolase family 18 protein [Aquimarina sp. AD10]|uniref:glycosyl hydrolase family 18 protein n=2 Tax=Aquimarina sp. AD10 TaxID=1714849 RepID=UPI000EA949CD|nr:glycosyl hydrolase family 18 protein [Aquimarina sp. AD10]RKM98466.1 hypothetical protein D7033_12370 [Aquimarina sp. AD10]